MKTILLALSLISSVCLADDPAAVKRSQAAAVVKYPEIGKAGTRFNQLFVGWCKEKRASNPKFFSSPDWPMRLADEVAKIKEEEDGRIAAIQEAAQLSADGFTATKGKHLAGASKEALDKAIELASANEQGALQEMKKAGLILVLKENMVVKVVDATIFPPRVKIRAKDTVAEIWTTPDAVADPEPK